MNKSFAAILVFAGIQSWFWPTFNGFWSPPAEVSTGEGHIIGAIFLVGAVLLWFMPVRKE